MFDDYDIKLPQIRNIVTDGGSNFCKMFKEFGKKIEETSTNSDGMTFDELDIDELNVEDSNKDLNEDTSNEPIFMEDANGELLHSEILNFNTVGSPEIEDLINDDYIKYLGQNVPEEVHRFELPEQRRCISHMINLISKDFDKALPSPLKTILVKAISKLHSLWVLTHKSSRAKHICKTILGICLLIPNETRVKTLHSL